VGSQSKTTHSIITEWKNLVAE